MQQSLRITPLITPSLSDPTDAELIRRIVRRDCAAFEQIYDRHCGKAMGLCILILGDRRASEDVLHESFWRAWQQAGRFDPARGSLTTWLLSIVHHCAIDELRKRRRSGLTVELDADDGETRTSPVQHANVMRTMLANMQSEQVKGALAQLPDAQRAIIMLAYFGGYTHQEIAARLNESLSTVQTRAWLGLSKLRDLLPNLKT